MGNVSINNKFNQALPWWVSQNFTQVPPPSASSQTGTSLGNTGNSSAASPVDAFISSQGSFEQIYSNQMAANQILFGFGGENQQLAGFFGQQQISNFNTYIENTPFSADTNYLNPIPGAFHQAVPPGGGPANPNNIVVNISPYAPGEALPLTDMEAVESYEDQTNQTTGWNPDTAAGEALSRDLSLTQNPLFNGDPQFSTNAMSQWWQNGHQDFINGNPDFNSNAQTWTGSNGQLMQNDQYGGTQTQNQASDRNPQAVGANMMFLSYLNNKLGYSWNQIINAKGNTLGEKYQSLTGQSGQQGFQNFINSIENLPSTDSPSNWEVEAANPNGSTSSANGAGAAQPQVLTTTSPWMFTNPGYTPDLYDPNIALLLQQQNSLTPTYFLPPGFAPGMAWARPGYVNQIG